MEPSSPWKKPNEVMQLHRLKKRKKALQERMKQPLNSTGATASTSQNTEYLDFSRIINGDKRKNPFSKNIPQESKKTKLSVNDIQLDESSDKTLFALMNLPAKVPAKPLKETESDKLSTFSNLLQKYTSEHSIENSQVSEKKYKHLPIDWALKTKLRLMSPKPFAWTQQLKASEEASGITGFVRCLDAAPAPPPASSPRARFHQCCLYWQHPQLPWLSLFPRPGGARAGGGRAAAPGGLAASEDARRALHTDWAESFRSLFQLLRARHCPYFYVCANTFTCLFRAAGINGISEPSALLTPTTRGFRQSLRQEDVEFTMPLWPDGKRKQNTSGGKDAPEQPRNGSLDSCYDTMDEGGGEGGSGDEDPDSDGFLSQLGFETDVIKKINNTQARAGLRAESGVDRAAQSLVSARGADAQALFNFLLNCKSSAGGGGALAGVPPTLLAPVAFHGAALQSLKVRQSTVVSDSRAFHSLELRGPLLPGSLLTLFGLLRGTAAAGVSAVFAPHRSAALCHAARAIAEDESSKENEPHDFAKAFNQENLSDCGFSSAMLQLFCSPDPRALQPLDTVKYNSDDDTFTW